MVEVSAVSPFDKYDHDEELEEQEPGREMRSDAGDDSTTAESGYALVEVTVGSVSWNVY
jgi:hypothetical protein